MELTQQLRESAFRAFQRAVQIAKGQSGFERLTGAKQQNVSNWLRRGDLLPGEFVLVAEAATGVSRHDLRPDIYPRGLQDDAPFRPDVLQLGEFDGLVAGESGDVLQSKGKAA